MAPRPAYLRPAKDDLRSFRGITATASAGRGSLYDEQHNYKLASAYVVSTRRPRVRIILRQRANAMGVKEHGKLYDHVETK